MSVQTVSRRKLLKLTAYLGGGLAIGGIAAACVPQAQPPAPTAAATAAAGPSATPAPTIRPRETITIGIFGGPQEPAFRDHVQKPLEQEQNAEVVVSIGNAGSRRPKVLAEKGNPSMDLVGQSLADVHEFVIDGILMPTNPKVKNFADIEPWAVERGYTYGAFSVGLRYNHTKIDKPTSLEDLWNPKYKGHVAIPNLPRNAIGPVLMEMVARLGGKDYRDTESAWKRFAQLQPNLILQYASVNDLNSLWKQQDVWLAVDASFSAWQFQFGTKGESQFVVPKEGGALMGNTVAVTVGSKHVELAEIGVGYFLGEAFQKAIAESNYFIPTRKGVTLKPEVQGLLPSKQQLVTVPTLEIARKIAEWSDRWNREMRG